MNVTSNKYFMVKQILNTKHQLSVQLFLSGTDTKRLSTSLRKILLDFIAENKDYLPIDFDLQLADLNMLFDFLDSIYS